MTKSFIHPNFLLQGKTAQTLYHEHAAGQPIIDYHCHLPPQLIAENHRFADLTEAWLGGDHYKWRAMRTNGIPERLITGKDSTPWQKFEQWAATVPYTLRNPLYHWTHLELNRPFGINDRVLNPDTAKGIWDECNALLATPEFTTQGLIKQMNVAVVCTTDDPIDDLRYHKQVAADQNFHVKMFPAWRPDKAMSPEDPAAFNKYVDQVGAAANVDIKDFATYMEALNKRHDYFQANGCRLSDHGLETIYAADYTQAEIAAIFAKVRGGKAPDATELDKFRSAMLYEFAVMDHAKGWVQQYHLGALRNNNNKLIRLLGNDVGADSIGDFEMAIPLARLLGRLDDEGKLTKTILYNLNPRDNDLFATMIGNYQDGTVPGKLQFGSGWWFLDQRDGMLKQIESLSNMGLLSRFVGMLTDSRSFLSYTRHEYFRRILCELLGSEVDAGLLPRDMDLLGQTVRDICYGNARNYFDFGLND